MSRFCHFFIVFCAFFAASTRAEIIDRIAVAVGNRVITTSDIERQIRVAAFLSGSKPDLSPASRRKTADTMVETTLIRQELETTRYPDPPSAGLDAEFAAFKQKYFKTDDEYRRALADAGLTDADVQAQLRWLRRWSAFVGVRFRPAVQVTDQDVQEYFDSTVAPAARAAAPPGTPINLEDFRDRILTKLTGDRQDAQMNLWLESARKRVDIVYHDEVFQ